jgi:hypothetical protein
LDRQLKAQFLVRVRREVQDCSRTSQPPRFENGRTSSHDDPPRTGFPWRNQGSQVIDPDCVELKVLAAGQPPSTIGSR